MQFLSKHLAPFQHLLLYTLLCRFSVEKETTLGITYAFYMELKRSNKEVYREIKRIEVYIER